MTSELRIKDVADASGFTTATLRYYEQIGLLPATSRTPAGYRMYDEHTVDRLAFIARAKQLGCTLDEIAGLTAAWDGGECGPVQDQLRGLVADKIVAAQDQISELATFAAQLQHAATALEQHRPDGACDATCGCVSEPEALGDERSTPQAVLLSTKPGALGEPDIACTLAAGSMKGRIDDWNALLAHVHRRERIDRGVRSQFRTSVPLEELIRLVTAEQDCCQFFEFAITVDVRGVALEVRAPDNALSVIEAMFGAPS
jgi:MerR family transcriptional regulator, copper efflux regulator